MYIATINVMRTGHLVKNTQKGEVAAPKQHETQGARRIGVLLLQGVQFQAQLQKT